MRQFATQIVSKLQSAGYQALWAGGCVRDEMLGITPNDYDVATGATPDQIRELFTHRKTIEIGAAFGVITVLGPKHAGQVEVATFRRDAGYSDGRHPDSVEFTDAREDAIRRDFTINGMFFDPLSETIIDYVGGGADLRQRLVRAIGNPHARIEEDKLRMLRGIRFAATYDFELEPDTWQAICKHASEISVVSAERIGAEIIRMLAHPSRVHAARMLIESGLLEQVLPGDWKPANHFSDARKSGSTGLVGRSGSTGLESEFTPLKNSDNAFWQQRLSDLEKLKSNSLEPAVYLLLRSWLEDASLKIGSLAGELQSAWRLNNVQRDSLIWINRHWRKLVAAESASWSVIQPLLIQPEVRPALEVAEVLSPGDTSGIEFCRQRLGWPREKLNPPPLLAGRDLIEMGIRPGPQFKSLLQEVRDQQLDGEIKTPEEAKSIIRNVSSS